MCNTYFCLTVKRVIAEAWCDNYFSSLFFFLVLPSQRQGQRERFYDVWVAIHKKIWMGAYWKLYLHGWLSLDLNEASSVSCKFYLFDHFIGQIVILFFLLYLFLFTFFFWIRLGSINISKLGLMKVMLAFSSCLGRLWKKCLFWGDGARLNIVIYWNTL